MPKYTNEQVIQSFRKIPPDNRFIGDLYDEVVQLLKPYVLRNSGSEYDISDLASDVFMILASNIVKPSFEFTSAYTTYIYSIAQHKWLQTLSNRKKIPTDTISSDSDIHYNNSDDNDTPTLAISDSQSPPDEEIALLEIKHLFHQLMGQYLGNLCRDILILRYEYAYSHKEIQAALSLNTESASKENLSRCSKKLKEKIENNNTYRKFLSEHYPFITRLISKP